MTAESMVAIKDTQSKALRTREMLQLVVDLSERVMDLEVEVRRLKRERERHR